MNHLELAPQALEAFSRYAKLMEETTGGGRVLSLVLYDDGSGHIWDKATEIHYLDFSDLGDLLKQLEQLL